MKSPETRRHHAQSLTWIINKTFCYLCHFIHTKRCHYRLSFVFTFVILHAYSIAFPSNDRFPAFYIHQNPRTIEDRSLQLNASPKTSFINATAAPFFCLIYKPWRSESLPNSQRTISSITSVSLSFEIPRSMHVVKHLGTWTSNLRTRCAQSLLEIHRLSGWSTD